MFTVEQIRAEVSQFVLDTGRDSKSSSVLFYINEARRLIWNRGEFPGIIESLRIRACNGILTLPYDYLKISDAMPCHHGRNGIPSTLGIQNEWYEYADNAQFSSAHSCVGHLIHLGDRFATFLDYQYPNHRLMIKGEDRADEGKRINFNAIDEYAKRLNISALVGLDFVPVELNDWIKYYRYVSKEKTVGRVRVYIFDPNRGNTILCAVYEADDTAPHYTRYRVPTPHPQSFYVRCKRRYRPLVNETDMVEFTTDAIIQACIAITARRNKDTQGFQAALQLAVEAENKALQAEKPLTGGHIRMTRQGVIHPPLPFNYAPGANRNRRLPWL